MGVRHVVKYDHDNGVKLPRHKRVIWCGVDAAKIGFDFTFQDASHALLSIENGSSILPCKKCLLRMKYLINNELNSD